MNIFERDVARGSSDRIDLHPHGKFLRAIDQHLRDAGKLRNLLRKRDLRIFIDRVQGQCLRVQADVEDGEIARIDLAETRRGRHLDRQLSSSNRQCRLYVERCTINAAVKVELDGDRGNAQRR